MKHHHFPVLYFMSNDLNCESEYITYKSCYFQKNRTFLTSTDLNMHTLVR